MIVVDSSAMVDLLLLRGKAPVIATHLDTNAGAVFVPHLLDVEVASALWRHALAGLIDQARLALAVARLLSLPLRRFGHELLIARALELRANVTAYDGVFLALAEALGARLLTSDARLADVPGHRVEVVVV
ncbi:MAG: type II toxin-antitoxin system VapC family toxin [Geodermatophilaceae bacterium]|nr:type II toxin-antitoxin system VapC family toxin [Geodermatophilaceae bacterium]MDQ3454827.1 type II toxin-antitoxin system VapC family toxin [Actinomycetota bacterium]